MSNLPIGWQFQERYECYCLLTASFVIALSSSASLVTHLRRSKGGHRWAMLPMLLAISLLYSVANVVYYSLHKDEYDFLEILDVDIKLVLWKSSIHYVVELLVSVVGALLALDRVLLMSLPLTYSSYKMGQKLATLSCAIALLTLMSHSMLVLFLDLFPEEFSYSILIHFNVIASQVVFPSSLLVEALLHVVFCVQFSRFARKRNNAAARKQAAQTNQITFFQILCQTSLCAVPHLFVFLAQLRQEWNMDWVGDVYPFYRFMFSISVALFSLFTVYKLRPKKGLVVIASSFSAFSNVRRMLK
ncbi:hypothetical protein QR680_008894 [Steinernema hermaphroditum]|uniref:Uncharacterized protein n=1 Tax=Steinernema hermaphroditum TaxID=289476 RepID=A0AA39IIB0_9BILA|nr:hypothetical protein QR680_008894 [Steinernema hermaphroditum]